MKILVTGGGGFIGNFVVDELLSRNIQVVVLTRDKNSIEKFSWHNLVTFIEMDINNIISNDELSKFAGIDKIIHLAWGNLDDFKNLIHIEKHLFDHYNFLKILIQFGIKDLTIIGTCLEYGLIEGGISPDIYPNPIISYGIAKNSLRSFLLELKKSYEFNFKWCRVFYLYGRGQSNKSIISQLESAVKSGEKIFNMSSGEQIRDYSKVEEIANQIVDITMQYNVTQNFNCCSGKPVKLLDFISEIIKIRGYNIKINPGYYKYNDYEPMEFWGVK